MPIKRACVETKCFEREASEHTGGVSTPPCCQHRPCVWQVCVIHMCVWMHVRAYVYDTLIPVIKTAVPWGEDVATAIRDAPDTVFFGIEEKERGGGGGSRRSQRTWLKQIECCFGKLSKLCAQYARIYRKIRRKTEVWFNTSKPDYQNATFLSLDVRERLRGSVPLNPLPPLPPSLESLQVMVQTFSTNMSDADFEY